MFCQSCGAQVTGAFCTNAGAREPAVTAFCTPVGLHSSASIPTIRATVPVRSTSAAGSQERPGLKILFVVLGILG